MTMHLSASYSEFKKSVEQLKRAVADADILGHPNFYSPEMFIVDTDYSQNNRAIGACLSQKQDGKEKVLAYGSKRLTKSQAKYHPFQGELCALLHFFNIWRYYLLGRKFRCRVDNTGLLQIQKIDPPDAMTARWLQTLANFDFVMEHRGSKSHGNADFLSRAPHLSKADGSTEDVEDDHVWQIRHLNRRTLRCPVRECTDLFTSLQGLEEHKRWTHSEIGRKIQALMLAGEHWTEQDWVER